VDGEREFREERVLGESLGDLLCANNRCRRHGRKDSKALQMGIRWGQAFLPDSLAK
jgi:hypothetical protein